MERRTMTSYDEAVRWAFKAAVDKQAFINDLRDIAHELSPLASQPVDNVRWVSAEKVKPNDYNPNSVARVEMKLLYTNSLFVTN